MKLCPAWMQVENEEELLAQLREKVGMYASADRLLYHIRAARGKLHWSINSYFREVMVAPMENGVPDFHPRARSSAAQLGACSTTGQQVQQEPAAGPGSGAAANAQQPDGVPPPLEGPQAPIAAATSGTSGASAHAVACAASPAAAGADADAGMHAGAAGPSLDSLPLPLLEDVLARLDVASLLHAGAASKALHAASRTEALWQRLFEARCGPGASGAHTRLTQKRGCDVLSQGLHSIQGGDPSHAAAAMVDVTNAWLKTNLRA